MDPSAPTTIADLEGRHASVEEINQAYADADLSIRFEDADFTYDDAPEVI